MFGSIPPVTRALILANVAIFGAQALLGDRFVAAFALWPLGSASVLGPESGAGFNLWQLVTYAFLHGNTLHLFFNMFALYFLGRLLEPGIGTPRFVALYFASLLAGSLGALLLSPDTLTIGASGAVFGIFGATFVIARHRGIAGLASSIGIILLLNLAITFGNPEISIGGHLGGLAGGVLCALFIVAGERGMLGPRRLPMELLAMAAIGFFSIATAIAIA